MRESTGGAPSVRDWPLEFLDTLLAHKVPCKFVAPNPKRGNLTSEQGQKSILNYDKYMTATTIDEFWALGGRWKDLKNDVQRGFCTLDAAALDAAWQEYDAGPKTPGPVKWNGITAAARLK